MNELFTFGLLCLTSFFTLINPLSIMTVFITMTSEMDDQHRSRTARKASFAALITLLVFAFSGQLLFRFFGISVDSFRVVGGVIFFLIGMDMLQARLTKTKIADSEIKSYVNDISITPLAIPMICGPGSITNGIVLMEDATTLGKKIIFTLAVITVIALTYLILLSSNKMVKILGETGINVMMRLMGLILMVIAVEFLFAGLRPFLQSVIA